MKKTPRSQAISLAEMLLLAIKKGEEYQQHLADLAHFPTEELILQLNTPEKKVAFWVNIYNSAFQVLAQTQSELLAQKAKLYGGKYIQIAQNWLSLDDIEHGILRRRKFKYGLGYIPSFFESTFIIANQVDALDFRIHFALNCGAVSCPPIAFYNHERLNEELEIATQGFLEQESEWNKESNTLYISRLFLWFLGDFGGRSGIREILKTYKIIDTAKQPNLKFKDYNWALALDNWA